MPRATQGGTDRGEEIAEWMPWGPLFKSWEGDDGALAVSYTNGLDTRYDGRLALGPGFVSISLAGVGGTVANANAIAMIRETALNVWHVYVARGTQTADILGSTLAVSTKASPAALPERVTSLLVTLSASGARELSEGMAATAYRVRTTIAATPTADTVATNSGPTIISILAQADDRVAGLQGQYAYGNILTGTTTMVAPVWNQVGRYDQDIVPTGFAMNRNFWMWGTNRGILMLNSLLNRFVLTFVGLSPDPNVARAMKTIPWLGTIIPMKTAVRQYDFIVSQTVGPERFGGNESPIKGTIMGQGFDERWAIWAYLNVITGTTYFLAVRPRMPGENHAHPLSFYCIGSTTNACEVVECLGTINGAQTQPIWMVGDGPNVRYFKAGLSDRWIDDPGYQFATSPQSAWLTELRRFPDEDKKILWVDFECINASVTQNIQIGFILVDARGGVSPTITVVNTNRSGRQRWEVSDELVARRFQPVVTMVTGNASVSPQIIGKIRVGFRRVGHLYGGG